MADLFDRLRAFLAELKRRRVYRVALAYVAVAFVGLQAVNLLIPTTTLPQWTEPLLLALAIFGFPVALVLAWAFEMTPEGTRVATWPEPERRGEPSGEDSPRGPPKLRKAYLGAAAFLVLGAIGYAGVAVFSSSGPSELWLPEIRSLAVLPLENLSGEPEQEYFSDGMTEALTHELGQIGALTVISRTSAMRYKESDKSIPEIAAELGVGALIEGSVLRAGDDVRITLQLVHGSSDRQLWGKSYQRDLKDVLALQSEVAQAIAAELEAELSPQERERLAARPTDDQEAFDLFLRARDYHRRARREDMSAAIELYERAIARDPAFVLALTHLSRAHSWVYFSYGHSSTTIEAARTAVDSALKLDPHNPEAHLARAYYHYWGFRDYEEALKQAALAAPQLSNDPDLFTLTGAVKRRQGLLVEAARDLERAFELDPRSSILADNIGMTYFTFQIGEFREAIRWFQRAVALDPDDPTNYAHQARAYLRLHGNTRGAHRVLREAAANVDTTHPAFLRIAYRVAILDQQYDLAVAYAELMPGWWETQSFVARLRYLARAHHFAGRLDQARTLYDSARVLLEDRAQSAAERQEPFAAYIYNILALVHGRLGRTEQALEAARTALQLLSPSVDGYVGPPQIRNLAYVHAILGQKEEALGRLEEYLSYAPYATTYLRIDPDLRSMHDDPRFEALLTQVERRREPRLSPQS